MFFSSVKDSAQAPLAYPFDSPWKRSGSRFLASAGGRFEQVLFITGLAKMDSGELPGVHFFLAPLG